ncbi:PREDICTED: arf-GAP with Rho-GAP domain, ANK repeat and PH domain-containing protein 1 [Polistes canadensis]|uniref:arf-GAP with Rho-GAP domain, ANK repeat and PH domain-containing protein 1 n=1 Tax=Polistes canadensis TaxID=91411 RepID=UPI000718B145|nr:PREDICTED: arf-GAP with Rho-GAP domain, ANK repeat and PH domain-containing protein 1 [Polistes canadensis]XP_014605439.1 PREDICTED: arf-GAP with Rho-GAP domain, ANK repeat and PH domain-containing protein 1 [Polistes canadensis]XP_014605440.1 PREDICTED: arf-GAP with Rho-GAP domain, ANK repeat and PH domain-containing protein 1 [Polistes canadensis]
MNDKREKEMEAKPIPKPRSIMAEHPVPAPRKIAPPVLPLPSPPTPTRSKSPSESSQSEKSGDENKSTTSTETRNSSEFFRQLSTSSRQLKDEISEKMSLKGRAVISSTKNASIRLEKSVKNLLTRRLTSLNQDDLLHDTNANSKKIADPVEDDRCVSMPTDDIFSSITFHSPFSGNLRSIRNEEDLSGLRHSPPPPVYPPPPLPTESIYDELNSFTSTSSSGRYDTLSSTISEKVERDFPESTFNTFNFVQRQASDSDQSLNLSDVNVSLTSDKSDIERRLSRSDSWTFYDTTPAIKSETINELDRISSTEEETLEQAVNIDRTFTSSNTSLISLQNSIYENCISPKSKDDQMLQPMFSDVRQKSSNKSLLFEFDPFAKTSEENVYNNFENNDLMLLEALLATNDSSSNAGSTLDLHEDNEDEEPTELEEKKLQDSMTPPEPPKRFDSLPKNEYDEVEIGKNPALLPKLTQMTRRKQPAVPPRKSSTKIPIDPSTTSAQSKTTESTMATGKLVDETTSNSFPIVKTTTDDTKKISVIQKLKKLSQDSTAHVIKPNVMNFVRSSSKLLSRNRDQDSSSDHSLRQMKMDRPKYKLSQCASTHRGIVYKTGVGIERAKDLVQRAAVLTDQKLFFYTDKSMSTLKETIHLETIYSIHLLQDVKIVDGETVHCIAISGETRPNIYIFYAKGISERRIWAQKILEAMTTVFPIKYTADLTRAGWVYLKEGITGTWFPAWVLLQKRTLVYTKSLEPIVLEYLDLRKARCIVLREQEGPNLDNRCVPVVVVDAGGSGALHIAAPGTKEAPAWRHALYQAATDCGPALHQQQITQDNVPVILDKCINFISTHGIMSEGIYRRSGSSSAVIRLLEAFRKDAWAIQITRGSYSEHDVATVLRRFLRDLPESLFPASIHDSLCQSSELTNEDERIKAYRNLLTKLDSITSATIRRILAHLHYLSQQSSRNLMTVENLSAIWGPTLMHTGENSAEDWNREETKVISDLIHLFPKLYQLSHADLAKEAKILEVLEKHHVSNNGLRGAPSGDLKIWIYLISREGECVNVTIGAQKTAFDICRELSEKANLPAHELCLEEYALSGALKRPLHHNERVLETVARWGYWDPDDRKDNILILKKDRLYKDIVPLVKPPMTISGELRFADVKSKNFKTYLFEFSQAKLYCYKDKVCSTKLHEWKIEDVIWYLGHEPKRNPQMGWTITFILRNKKPTRCKENPFFGNILAGTSKDEQYKWLAAMLFGEFQMNLCPSAINLMDI